jgi:signal transduction histidine kinase
MADAVRAFDWSATPLGPIEQWSETLLCSVNMILASRFPSVIFWGPEMTVIYNDDYTPFLADKHPGVLGQSASVCWKEAWHIIGPQFDAAMARGETTFREDALVPVMRNGHLQDVYWTYSYSPIFARGEIQGILIVCRDVTAKLLAERERGAMARQLAQVLEATNDGVAKINREWQIVYLNSRAMQIMAPSGDVMGRNHWEAFPETVYEGSPCVEHYYRAMNERMAGEFILFYPEPLNVWFQVTVQPAEDGIIVFFTDVTEKKKADDIRQENEMKLRMATEAAELGIFIWHVVEDRVLWENDRVYEIFRRTRLDGPLNIAEFAVESVHPNYAESCEAAVQQTIRHGARFYFQGEFNRKDGSSGWIELTGQQLESTDNGLPIRIIGTVQDITERKKGEALLLTAEKLTAVGRLAASIAHEINNPLEAVTNLLYLARHSADLAEAQEYLTTAEQELGRVSAITSQTLRFHRQSTSPTSTTCEALTEGALALYRSRIVNLGITVEERWRAAVSVLCFEGEIRQVINNLVGNAVDAMTDGGRLLVRSRLGTTWSRRAPRDVGRRGLIITIADTGSGMSPTVLKKIFEPFFTTKGIAGTGLGLWISQEIILRHRGTLSVRTSQREQSHGTVFTLFLPLDAVDRGVEDRGAEDRGPEKAIVVQDRAAEIEALRKLASLSAEVSS